MGESALNARLGTLEPMSFVIRTATPEDAADLALVRVTSWRETYSHILSAEFLDQLDVAEGTERWRRSLETGRADTMVLDVNGEVRGYATAGAPHSEEKPRDLELYMIYQLASEHGNGSGQALLDATIQDRPCFVWVAELNPRAIAFYHRNGFEPDGAREVAEQWENLAEIRMVR